MAYQLFQLPRQTNLSAVLTLVSGAKALFELAETSTLAVTYQDPDLTVPHANPVVADAAGVFPPIYLNPEIEYRVTLKTSANVTLPGYPLDYVNDQLLSQAIIGRLLYPRTAAEIAAAVTPTNYAYPPYTILRYYSGSGDATTALQAAIDCAEEADHCMVTVGRPGVSLAVGSAWTIDTNKTGVDFQGAFLDASAFTSGNWCTPTQSASDVNQRPILNAAHPIQNFTAQGPGHQNTTAKAIYLNDANVVPTIAGLVFRDYALQDWGQWVYFDNGAFCNTFINGTHAVTVAGSSGPATTYGITQANTTNTGERNVFISCGFYNTQLLFQCLNTNANIEFQNCSADYFTRAFSVQGGVIRWFGGHIESDGDTDYWGHVTGVNSALIIKGTQLNLTANKTTWAMFQSDSDNGGVFLEDVYFGFGAFTFTTRLIGGTGFYRVRNAIQSQAAERPTIGSWSNLLAYGDVESASYTADWSLADGAIRSSAQAHAGTYSLSLPGSAGITPTATAIRACRPGQYVQGELWYMATGVTGTSATFSGSLAFIDGGGNILQGDTVFTTTTTVGSWTKARFKLIPPAPAGTINVRLSFGVFSTASGTPTGFVDDIIFNLTE